MPRGLCNKLGTGLKHINVSFVPLLFECSCLNRILVHQVGFEMAMLIGTRWVVAASAAKPLLVMGF